MQQFVWEQYTDGERPIYVIYDRRRGLCEHQRVAECFDHMTADRIVSLLETTTKPSNHNTNGVSE